MKDISLDDQIAKDKQKNKQQHARKPGFNHNRRGGERGAPNRKFQRNNNRFDNNRNYQQGKPGRFVRDNRDNRDNRDDRDNRGNKQNDRNEQPRNNRLKKLIKKPRQNTTPKEEVVEKKVNQAPKFQKGRTLKVLGLHPDFTNEELYKLFATEGALDKCMIQQDNFGRNLPSALVQYHTAESAKNAIANINNKKMHHSVLTVEPYKRN